MLIASVLGEMPPVSNRGVDAIRYPGIDNVPLSHAMLWPGVARIHHYFGGLDEDRFIHICLLEGWENFSPEELRLRWMVEEMMKA